MRDVVICGSGPAGLTAAIYTARAGLSPLVLDGAQPGGQLITTTAVENFPGFPAGIDGPDLMQAMREQAARFGAEFASASVAAAEFRERPLRLTLDDGRMVESRTIIVATGASARYLGLESEQRLLGRGVSGCATCDGSFFRGVPVAVVGGGDTAMEEALFLTRFASSVTVIHRRAEFRASRVMAERVLTHPKIQVLWDTVVEEVLDVARQEVTGLRLRNVRTGERFERPFHALFVAIGHEPNSKPFCGQLEMGERGYIRTDGTRTSAAGVFAAGDVQDPSFRQAVTAAGSGCMAALEAERYLRDLGR